MPRRCFVIGPIGPQGSAIRAAADAFMEYIVEPSLAVAEFDYSQPILRADTLGEPGRITSQIITQLLEVDLVIADLTTSNPNVYYELSLRHTLGKPAIHMAEQGTVLPFDIHDNRTISYTMDIRDVQAARAELERQIRLVHAEGYKASNPITETVGIIQLARSENPIQQVLSTVVKSVEILGAEVRRLSASQLNTTNISPLAGLLAGGKDHLGIPFRIGIDILPQQGGLLTGFAGVHSDDKPAAAGSSEVKPGEPKDKDGS